LAIRGLEVRVAATRTIMVTPALAAAWLAAQQPGSLAPDAGRVAQLARQLAAGQLASWTADPVRFSRDGVLQAGTSRLHAIGLADAAVALEVSGTPPGVAS
jgi:hypothetical protein